jgi:hypothetical protein
MVTQTALILKYLIAIRAAEWSTTLSVGISHMYIQVVLLPKFTVTLRAGKF